uniref:Lipocalin n=1 Tax=Amblyomma triste TaxID=251400 RepID=A0A023G894_AMBTT
MRISIPGATFEFVFLNKHTASTAESADAGTTGSPITKEKFLQKMQTSGPYWTWMTSYQDPTQTQKRTCISTNQVTETSADADTVFVQKYKFKGCTWYTYTHDAYYNVTFEEDKPSATNGLKMHWVPIAATQSGKPDEKVYGTARNYSFKYWDDQEECFVLTYSSTADQKECELLVWNPEVTAKPETQVGTEAKTEEKTEAEVEGRFKTCKKHYKTECPTGSQDVLFDEYCKITETGFLTLITNPPKGFNTSSCTVNSQ